VRGVLPCHRLARLKIVLSHEHGTAFEQHRDEIVGVIEKGVSKAEMKRQTGLAYATVSKYVEQIESGAAER